MSDARSSVAFDPPACEMPASDAAARRSAGGACNETQELQRAISGDAAAASAIFRRHHGAIYRFAWLITGSETQADDVTQDVFVELLCGRSSYRPACGSLAAYLCGIARHCCYRTVDRRMQSVDDWDVVVETHAQHDAPSLPLDQLERSRSMETLYSAIRKLPPLFRDVLVLVELQQLSYAETAAITGIELGTVRSRLSRAKDRLAQMLNGTTE